MGTNKAFYQLKDNNEAYTTKCESDKLVDFIIERKAIPFNTKIWLPFDTKLSRIYQSLKEKGFTNLILTNLENGEDFYLIEPKEWDMIITNPPFSNRTQLFHRLFSFGKPFIILQGQQMWNNYNAVNYLCKYDGEIAFLLPERRMRFMTEKDGRVHTHRTQASFYSFWLTYKISWGGGVFIRLLDNGREKELEILDLNGNPILDNHFNLFSFNWKEQGNNDNNE